MLQEENKKNAGTKDWFLVGLAGVGSLAVLAIVLAFVAYRLTFDGKVSPSREVWGQFGDFLGGTLNPVFGFLTVTLLIITTVIQRRELRDARDAALKNTDLVSKQLDLLEEQSKEQTFFRLLEDFDKDKFVMKCTGRGENIFYSVYEQYKIFNGDSPALNGIAPSDTDMLVEGVYGGQFIQIFLTKLVLMLGVIEGHPRKSTYIKLIQSRLGAPLTAAVCQFAYLHKRGELRRLVQAKIILRGIGLPLIFIEGVVVEFLPEKLEEYQKQREVLKAKLDDQLNFMREKIKP